MRYGSDRKILEHVANVESITISKQISDAFIADKRIERTKSQQRKEIISNSRHHGCDFDAKFSEQGKVEKSYADVVREDRSFSLDNLNLNIFF